VSTTVLKEYYHHLRFGLDILTGCHMIFSFEEEVRAPAEQEKVINLFRRAMSVAIEVGIGLERLGYITN
jgi:hypothetical protein